ncbi:unnamed protein product [Calicophoron daubneyi]|uniref:RRM domain-containing protein n=1 Tax=Calicophoron daubneyi TaxID=300641 RepID=A0AAV2T573_CALDB
MSIESDVASSRTDSDSDESSDDAGDQELLEKVKRLQTQLEENPNDYDSHNELIVTLKKLGNLDELRQARENMSAVYPLSPALWLDWIRDERNIATTVEEQKNIERLFRRAISDYEDVNLWLEYCQYAIGNSDPGSSESLLVTQGIFEEALGHQGLNVASGAVLWEVYREFQYVTIARLKQVSEQSAQEQVKKIDKLFRRQLSIPLLNMQSTLTEYEEFLKGIGTGLYPSKDDSSPIPHDCLVEYKNALAVLEKLVVFEDLLEEAVKKSEGDAVAAWESYLDWAVQVACGKGTAPAGEEGPKRKGKQQSASKIQLSPNQVCCLFERAITAHCLYPSIWTKFLNYLDEALSSDTQRALQVMARSVRNCPWSVDLWLRYAALAEAVAVNQFLEECKNGSDQPNEELSDGSVAFAKVEAVFETALGAGLQDPSELLRIWLGYCDYRVRRLVRTDRSSLHWQTRRYELTGTFERAIEELDQQFGKTFDPDGVLLQYAALASAKHVGDMGHARFLWSQLMKRPGQGSKAQFWLAYLQFERNWGDVKHFLRISAMAINSISGDQGSAALRAILRLACELGVPIDRYRDLEIRVRSRLHALEQRSNDGTERADESTALGDDVQMNPASQTQVKKKGKVSSSCVKPGEKRTHATVSAVVSAKKPKLAKESPAKKPTPADSSKAPGVQDARPSAKSKSHGEFVTHDFSKDDRTVFVSNLSYSVTEEQLRETFKSCGILTSVRLVYDYAGRSKGFAYVEFQDPASARLALEMDRKPVVTADKSGESNTTESNTTNFPRPMFVSPCDPSRTQSTGFHYTAGRPEPEKLFVRNLDRHVTREALEEIFSKHGKVVSVRLATYRSGAPKGHAYVEFTNADDASRALVATDGILVGNKQISVAISNPPVHSKPLNVTASSSSPAPIKSTEGTIKESELSKPESSEFAVPSIPVGPGQKVRTHARPQLAFLPRAIHRSAADQQKTKEDSDASNAEESSVGLQAETPSKGKTNEDFRKMLF